MADAPNSVPRNPLPNIPPVERPERTDRYPSPPAFSPQQLQERVGTVQRGGPDADAARREMLKQSERE